MNLDMQKIGTYIQLRRRMSSLTQAQLGERLHVTSQSVSNWERGLLLPDTATLPDLAEILQTTVDAILSGGELKRIEIATVLARSTRLSVFDEPEAGIDLWSFQNLIQVFEKMRAQIHDSSIMIISHQERILEIADEIVVLRDGRIDASGPREEILPALIGTPSAVEACKILKSK